MRRVLLSILIYALAPYPSLGAPTEAPENHFELGVALHTLIPNRLPDFDGQVFGYGPWVGIPIGNHTIQVQGLYGSDETNTVYLTDLALRLNVETPFFTGFFIAGAHVLYYQFPGSSRTFVGGNTGIGFTFSLTKTLDAHLQMRVYHQQRVYNV